MIGYSSLGFWYIKPRVCLRSIGTAGRSEECCHDVCYRSEVGKARVDEASKGTLIALETEPTSPRARLAKTCEARKLKGVNPGKKGLHQRAGTSSFSCRRPVSFRSQGNGMLKGKH